MSKREKIILIIMGISLLFGGYFLFFNTPKKKSSVHKEVKIKELQVFVNDMLAKVSSSGDFTDKDAYIIEKATSPWEYDPFSTKDLQTTTDVNSRRGDQEIKFTYSGYIQIGKKLIAVINGLEYDVGEELVEPGYVVHSITPKKVMVKVGNREMIALPLESTM